ncbi:MAG: septum formation protein Maf [Candidatus Marinimicrobia bacterium]|nr:septum formation protein Maf [Candidatus Neomarinimicrobiota bacterium]OUW50615.1 MAG: septum formation protein Maf [bacterium TMED190]
MCKLILASSSERRKDILKMVKLNFDVIPSNIDENYEKKLSPKQIVKKLSQKKAMAVSNKYPNSYVIGADTIVNVKNKILNKPKNKIEAFKMLKFLSNTEHLVLTGVCLINKKDNVIFNFVEITKVYFYKLDEELILRYINTKSPYDKSGSYGIQDYSAGFVKKIEGCYYNVVGFPISKFLNVLRTFPKIESISI